MLDQGIQWLQMAGTVAECVLLLRIITLKLHRVYTFVTLYWAVNVLFDGAAWTSGWTSRATERIWEYSLFVLAFLFPLVCWEVFEELKGQIARIRRIHASRLISGLFMTALLGVIWSVNFQDDAASGTPGAMFSIGLFVCLGSACASLLFIWNVYRSARKQGIAFPKNTFVWAVFFMLTLGRSILESAAIIATPTMSKIVSDVVQTAFLLFDVSLAVWCIFKLRALPSDVASHPEKASFS